MHGREGGRVRGGGPFFYSSSQQCVKKLKKSTTTFFLCSRGTDCKVYIQPGVVSGASLGSRSCLLLLLLFFFFLFSEMLPPSPLLLMLLPPPLPPPSPYAVAARQIPTYLTLCYLTCRVADFTILGTGTYLSYETTNEHDECWIADLGHIMMHPECEGCVCVCNCVCVCVCVSDW